MTKNLERKKKEQIQERTNWRMPICNPTIQLVVANLYTKFEVSILKSCGDIFDEKIWRDRKKKKYTGEQKEKTNFQFHDITCRCEPVNLI